MPCGSCSSAEDAVFCNRCRGFFCNACKEKDFLCVGAVTNHIDVSRCIVYLTKQIEFYENCLQNSKSILTEVQARYKWNTFVSTPVLDAWTDEDEMTAERMAHQRYYEQARWGPQPESMSDVRSIFQQYLEYSRRQIRERKTTVTCKVDMK